ncbi:MAG: monovalent cation/H(+) antiporter subunit G [bacterium]|nr:monovalent cation/H(+) antiporter subunit G [bacterium]
MILAGIFIFIGVFLVVTGSIGIIKFPDFYSRTHPAGKIDSLAIGLISIGCIIYNGIDFVAMKLIIIVLFVMITSPTATHALVKAAYKSGLKYYKKNDS